VPLPASAEALRASAALGALLAVLLDPDQPVSGITSGTPEPPLGAFGAITRAGGGQLEPADVAITAAWGHGGAGRTVMPGQGRLTERDAYTGDEFLQVEVAAARRGETTADLLARLGAPVDVWLNDTAYWRTVPSAVWEFRIGGYQVVKKWLSRCPTARPMCSAGR
jgi:type ISP restriction-modification system protein